MATSNNNDALFAAGGIAGLVAEIENLITESQNGLQVQSGGGGGYQFTPSELESVLGQWQQLQATLQDAQTSVENMTDVQPPATDTASQTATSAASRSGQAYQDHLNAMVQYSQEYVQALQTALTNYQNAEEGGSQSMRGISTV
ncbi:MAG TPA: PE domain-containing protein [Pseudonocardiaceae bacterium]|jgi:Skp family chaperone for outer membrane proteins|nr:PE domain-containing protein [Pseudonocardiaceae bacterium]